MSSAPAHPDRTEAASRSWRSGGLGSEDWGLVYVLQSAEAKRARAGGDLPEEDRLVAVHFSSLTGDCPREPQRTRSRNSSTSIPAARMRWGLVYVLHSAGAGVSGFESSAEEVLSAHIGLPEDRSERSFRKVARMIGYRRVPVRGGVEPDLVTSCGLAVELKTESPEPAGHVPVTETRESSQGQAPTTSVKSALSMEGGVTGALWRSS